MKFPGPDAAVRWWAEARERADSIPSCDPVGMQGLSYGRECAKCGTKPYRVATAKDGALYATCKRCGREREKREVFLLRGRVQAPRSQPLGHVDALADVELVLEAAARSSAAGVRVLMAHVLSPLPRPELVAQLNAAGVVGVALTEYAFRRLCNAGRRAIAWELHTRDMLSSEWNFEGGTTHAAKP